MVRGDILSHLSFTVERFICATTFFIQSEMLSIVNEVFNPMTHFPEGALPMFILLSSLRRVRYFTTSLIFVVSLFSKLQMACFYLGSITETR